MNDDEIIARGGTQDDIDRYAESYGINTPQEDKELQHIEDLLVIYGNAPTGANRTRIMQLIKARDEQREREIHLRGKIEGMTSIFKPLDGGYVFLMAANEAVPKIRELQAELATLTNPQEQDEEEE